VAMGALVRRGDRLGTIYTNGQTGPHLHWALVEIIGRIPGARYVGANLHQHFLRLSGSATKTVIRFAQNGTPPAPVA
jgi:murein DD-endopeptidase MepM/ murein hydrolase activator NlpD